EEAHTRFASPLQASNCPKVPKAFRHGLKLANPPFVSPPPWSSNTYRKPFLCLKILLKTGVSPVCRMYPAPRRSALNPKDEEHQKAPSEFPGLSMPAFLS